MLFTRAFTALQCIFEVIMVVAETNVITLETRGKGVNACGNSIWKR